MRNISGKIVEKIKTYTLCSLFSKIVQFLLDNVEKCRRPEEPTDDNMVHAHRMLYK